jgi:hypothetical protein
MKTEAEICRAVDDLELVLRSGLAPPGHEANRLTAVGRGVLLWALGHSDAYGVDELMALADDLRREAAAGRAVERAEAEAERN